MSPVRIRNGVFDADANESVMSWFEEPFKDA